MAKEPTLEPGIDCPEVRRLAALAREAGAFLTGEFTLTSGRKSNYYIDGRRITLSPEGAYLLGKAINDVLGDSEVAAVGGVATGAYPMVASVAVLSQMAGKPRPVFVVREVAKEHGAKRQIEGHLPPGAPVAILEDVLTTGGSVLKAVAAVEAAGSRVARIIVLVDRGEGGRDNLEAAGYPVTSLLRVIS